MDVAFGNWLAGFIDGEGCFTMSDKTAIRKGAKYHYCTPIFTLCVRLDDAQIVREIHAALGVGKVYVSGKAYGPTQPSIRLHIQGVGPCARLVEVLTEFPLRAKKARDFEIWRMAVTEQAGRKDLPTLLAYKDALVGVKQFDSDVVPQVPTSPQLRLVEGM
jgi:hypothetical protein